LALHLIGQQPSHGYDLIRAVGELVGGDYQPSPGTMYPTLSVLVDMGHVTATESAGGRKQYAITQDGQAALAEQDESLQRLLSRLSDGRRHERHQRPAQLVRALENFKTALRLKLDGRPGAPAEPLTEAQIKALAAVLDQAALQIEQV
jgi:DNA-binding PadR family transcriptional regulator